MVSACQDFPGPLWCYSSEACFKWGQNSMSERAMQENDFGMTMTTHESSKSFRNIILPFQTFHGSKGFLHPQDFLGPLWCFSGEVCCGWGQMIDGQITHCEAPDLLIELEVAIRDFPDNATFREKSVNTGLVRHTLGFSLIDHV